MIGHWGCGIGAKGGGGCSVCNGILYDVRKDWAPLVLNIGIYLAAGLEHGISIQFVFRNNSSLSQMGVFFSLRNICMFCRS